MGLYSTTHPPDERNGQREIKRQRERTKKEMMCEVKDAGRHGWEVLGWAGRSVDGCADGCLVDLVDLVDWLGGWINGALASFSQFATLFFLSFWVLLTWVTGRMVSV